MTFISKYNTYPPSVKIGKSTHPKTCSTLSSSPRQVWIQRFWTYLQVSSKLDYRIHRSQKSSHLSRSIVWYLRGKPARFTATSVPNGFRRSDIPWSGAASARRGKWPGMSHIFGYDFGQEVELRLKLHRRKFRSETSDNMDSWKSRGGKSQRGEEKKIEDQRRENQKKEKVGARKGRKVAIHCFFPMICGSGGSKSNEK